MICVGQEREQPDQWLQNEANTATDAFYSSIEVAGNVQRGRGSGSIHLTLGRNNGMGLERVESLFWEEAHA